MKTDKNDFDEHRTGPKNIKRGKDVRAKKPPGKKQPKKISERYLYNSGLAYLQKFTSSVPNFRRVMRRKIERSCKAHPEQVAEDCFKLLEDTIATFERQGLLSDEAYLNGMINSLRRRGLSRQAIESKLQQKGLLRDHIRQAMETNDVLGDQQNPDFAAAVLFTRRKKLGPFRQRPDDKPNRELSALARAGFSYETAQRALTLPLAEAEDVLAATSL